MQLFINAMWAIIRFFHSAAHLTLVTSTIMAGELARFGAAAASAIQVCMCGRGWVGGWVSGSELGYCGSAGS